MYDTKPLRSFFFDRRLLSTLEHTSATVGTGGGGMSTSLDDSAITGSRARGTDVFVVAAVEAAINSDWKVQYGLCTSILLQTTFTALFADILTLLFDERRSASSARTKNKNLLIVNVEGVPSNHFEYLGNN